jgi:twitching motility protein PilI
MTTHQPQTVKRKRISLRGFQNELAVRIANRADMPDELTQLGFFAGGRRWLCALNGISEILFPTPITSVPLAQGWFLGLTNVRGNLHSVIDFSLFLGEKATVSDDNSRLILFNDGGGNSALNLALLVRQVYGLRAKKGFAETSPAPQDPKWCAQSWADADGNRWSELDLPELTRDPRFQHIGR